MPTGRIRLTPYTRFRSRDDPVGMRHTRFPVLGGRDDLYRSDRALAPAEDQVAAVQ
jgi:hypothetical protein